MAELSAGQMRLKVLRIGGDSFEVDVSDTATVEQLKRHLVDVARLPLERQRLIFRGRVLQNGTRLFEAGVHSGHTLHLVDMPPGAVPPQAQQQQGAAGGGEQPGAMGFDFMGGLLNGLGVNPGGAPQGIMHGPGGMHGTILGPFVVSEDPGAPGGAGNLGAAITQQIMAALGGGGPPPGQQQGPAPAVPPTGTHTVPLRLPELSAPRVGGRTPYPHLLTGLNLMMSRMEHEVDDPELDPLPRIRENYGRPSGSEILHFLRAARTLLNTSPLLRPTRAAVGRVLEAAGLPPLRALPWQRGEDDDEWEAEGEGEGEGEGAAGGQGGREASCSQRDSSQRRAGAAGGGGGGVNANAEGGSGRNSSASGPVSFPVLADSSEEEEEGEQGPRRGGRRRVGGRAAPAAGRAAALASSQGAADDGPSPLEPNSDDNEEDRVPALASDDEREGGGEEYENTEEVDEEARASSVPNEDLLLVAAVCLGELASRFLDLVGVSSDDPLWDMADELRALARVRPDDYPRLAEDVQQLTARMYRLGSMWAELSRGMQYLGAALERGNMAVVSAIPGFLSVHCSQVMPNLQRPGYPPHAYLPANAGYFAGQIPDSHHWHAGMGPMSGMPVQAAVVDVAMGPFPPGTGPAGAAAGLPAEASQQGAQPTQGERAAPGAQQQGVQQQGAQQQATLIGNIVGSAIAGAAGIPPPGAAQPSGAQPGQQAGRHGTQQAIRTVDSLMASTRTIVEQATQRVQDARYAMQAVIAGGDGGPQMVLQRAHQAMQSMVLAEEAMGRARQRSEQASQHMQRLLRTQQGQQGQQAQQAGQPQVVHQAVRITVGPAGVQVVGAPGGGPGVGDAEQQQAHPRGAQQAQHGTGAALPAGDGTAFTAIAQQLLAGMGMSLEAQQGMMHQLSGMAQALRQSSLSALDLPALLADVRTALGAALREAARQAQQRGTGGAEAGAADTALAEAALPRLTAAVGGVLERHLARLGEAPALREFMPYLEQMGIRLPAAAAGDPASRNMATSAPTAEASSAPPPPAASQTPAVAAAQPSAARAAPAAAPMPAAPEAASAATAPKAAAAATEQHPSEAPSTSTAAAAAVGAAAASGSQPMAGAGSSKSKHKPPAGLGLGKGLGRPAPKKRDPSAHSEGPKAGDAVSLGAELLQVAAAAASGREVAGEGSSARPAEAVAAAAAAHKAAAPPTPKETAAAAAAGAGAAEASAPAGEHAPAPPTAQETAVATIPPRPLAPRGPPGAGGDLAGLLGGLLGPGAAGPAGGAGGGGGGGLLGMMSSVMQSPAFMQMAQSPAMQQMAERMLGGAGGGGLDMNLMGELMGDMLGGRPGQAGPRARGAEGVLGGGAGASSSRGAPADLDSALCELPAEDAERWRGIIEADTERQAHVAVARRGDSSGFSDAYSALRMSGRGSGGSGLLRMLAGGEDKEDEDDSEE